MHILVTGGAGYIGSHTCVELLDAGHEITVVDNLIGSKAESIRRVEEIAGRSLTFYPVDLLDTASLDQVFQRAPIEAVIHFAALKAPGESVSLPLRYYQNNITGILNLLASMGRYGVRDLVFSSSAAVYGNSAVSPVSEESPRDPVSPYARTKTVCELILEDLHVAEPDWNITILRYFNPVGAHPSGRIGEDPLGTPNNLMPMISRAAAGRQSEVLVYGNDYPTPDGTGIRDYIHVVDLARGHLKAIDRFAEAPRLAIYNLGNNRGYSVLEIISAFETTGVCKVPYRIVGRRPGDIAISFADASKANRELGWRGERSLEQMCADVWRWQLNNPHGYG